MVVHAKSGGMADENGTKKIQMRIERLEVGKGGISEDLTALLEEVSATVVLFHLSQYKFVDCCIKSACSWSRRPKGNSSSPLRIREYSLRSLRLVLPPSPSVQMLSAYSM